MTALRPTDNLSTQDPGAHSDGGPFPGQAKETPKTKEENLPVEHAPTVPLPETTKKIEKPTPEIAKVEVEKPVQKVEETIAPIREEVTPAPTNPTPGKKPAEVELPGEESPELAETVAVWPKSGTQKADESSKPEVPVDIPPLTTKEDVKDTKPTLEIGPTAPKKGFDFKKILKIGGVVLGVLFLVGVAYGFITGMGGEEVMVVPEVDEEVVEVIPEEEEQEQDITSIDFLEHYYDGVSKNVDVLEDSVIFEDSLELRSTRL